MVRDWDRTEMLGTDWFLFRHQWEAAYVAVTRYSEIPLWDPWKCGGIFLLGDPVAQIYSPLFLLAFLLGTVSALKLTIVLNTAAGIAGMYLCCRRLLGVGWEGAALGAVVFGASSFFSLHVLAGHPCFLPYYLLPWLLMAWRAAIDEVKWAAAIAMVLTMTIAEGGAYPLAHLWLVLILDGVTLATDLRRLRGVVVAWLVSGVLFALVGAFRLLPILETVGRFPRPTDDLDAATLMQVYSNLTERASTLVPSGRYPLGEYGGFIGPWGVLIGGLGLLLALRGRRWVVVGATFFLLLTLGDFSRFAPWSLLHMLPGFGSMRVPSRFIILLTFYLALAAGLALDRAVAVGRALLRSRVVPSVLALLVVGGIACQMGSEDVIGEVHYEPIHPQATEEPEFYLVPAPGPDESAFLEEGIHFPARGVGQVACVAGTPYYPAPGLWTGPGPQVRVESGRLNAFSMTANTATADVTLASEGDLTFNRTWAPDWVSNVGRVEADALGRVVVRGVPAGSSQVRISYAPRELMPGLLLSVLGVAGCVALWAGGAGARR